MRSKDIIIGMKVIPISKSVRQNFESWKSLHQRSIDINGDSLYLKVTGWDICAKAWTCETINGVFGYFLAKDLVEYQE